MKKINTLLCLVVALLVTIQAYTQVPTKIWDKTVGSGFADDATSMVGTSDGGFVIAGYSSSGISGDKTEASRGNSDYWIVKINSAGQKVWDKTIGGSNSDRADAIITTSDGGYLVAGYSYSGISGDKTEANKGIRDFWVVKLNSLGQKVWDKTLGGSGEDLAHSIIEASDGGFVIAGGSSSGISGDKTEASRGDYDYWIVKINSSGQKVWDKTIGTAVFDGLNSVIATSDGGYILAGYTASGISGDKSEAGKGSADFWIVKLNSLGQKVWDKSIGGNGYDSAQSIISTSDNGVVIAGYSFSNISGDKTEVSRGEDDFWIVKLNSLGQKIWDKTIGGNDRDNSISIMSSSDGGVVILGYSPSGISGDKSEASRGGSDYWTVKLNSLGQKIWDKTIGGSGTDYTCGFAISSDGGFVIAGSSPSGISGDKSEASKGGNDYWIVKLQVPCPTFTNNIAYVNATATGTNTGVDWANAFTSLESALIADRTCNVGQIWVARGTYKPSAYPTVITGSPTLTNRDYTFELKDGTMIYGGFVGTETALTQRVQGNTTILSGDIGTVGVNTDNCYHVLLSNTLGEYILDGLTISGGNANGSEIITNVRQFSGGGLYNINASPRLFNIIFSGNFCEAYGAGMFNESSVSASFTNVIFSGNSSDAYGGGIYIKSSPIINFKNVLFYNNTAFVGGGLFNITSSPNLINAVFLKNKAVHAGGGINTDNSTLTVKNSIFRENQIGGNISIAGSDLGYYGDGGDLSNVSYTSLQLANNTTNYPTANFPNIGTSNNIFAQNPLFINDTDPDGADNIFMTADDGLSLQSASPCKDAGTATGAPTTDITGAARVGNVDMGAYEFQGAVLCSSPTGATAGSNSPVTVGSPINLTSSSTGGTSQVWAGQSGFSSTAQNPTIASATLAMAGIYTVTIASSGTCTATATVNVVVNPTPTSCSPPTGATAGSNSPVFVGGTINLISSSTGGTSQVWTGPSSFNSTAQNPSIASATLGMAGIYTVTITSSGTCTATATVNVVVNPLPTGAVVFVNVTNVSPTQDGNSWATAYSNLQTALSFSPANSEIWVAQGTYKTTTNLDRTIYFNIPNGAMLFGGFVGTEVAQSQRNFKNNPTILSGEIGLASIVSDNSYHVVTFDGANTTTRLDGFTVTSGNANLVGNSLITNPSSSMLPISTNDGGGIALDNGSSPMIINCKIINNNGTFGGGLFATNASKPTIENCVFLGNQATFGGGVYHLGSKPIYNNVLFAGNKATGGAVYNNGSNATFTNVTIAGNGGLNGAIFNSVSTPVVKNSIIYGNIMPFNDTQSLVTYSIVEGGFAGVGNLNLNPQFINLTPNGLSPNTTGDYQLTNTSPAIDAGENGSISLTDKDLIGNLRRYNGGIVDMGAYEFQGYRVGGTIISIVSGNWEIGSTWNIGRQPLAGDNVIINNNHNVTLNATGTFKNMEIRTNAKLIHNSIVTKLQAGI